MTDSADLLAGSVERPGTKDDHAPAAAGVRVGILDHTGPSLGGGQFVAAYLASILARTYQVDYVSEWKEFGLDRVAAAFTLDLGQVRQRCFPAMSAGFGIPGELGFLRQIRRSRDLTKPYDVFIYCGQSAPPFCQARHGIVYCHFPIEASPVLEMRQVASWPRRNRLDRWMRGTAYQMIWRSRLRGYDLVLANSAFTADWIERRWGVRAEIVYPPVDLDVPCTAKENLIVSIGRFDGVKGRKGHLAQLKAFRKFLEAKDDSWKLCLIGSCYGAEERSYLALVQETARNLPVEFAINAERAEVCSLLARAKIFWHTAGLFDDEQNKPYKAEHFGIATVEAMRAGCVPIVIASGGQREIIRDGVHGFLCRDLRALVETTSSVAENDALREKVAEQTRCRSADFNGEKFGRRMREIVERCLGHVR